jgi:hypothetical protein
MTHKILLKKHTLPGSRFVGRNSGSCIDRRTYRTPIHCPAADLREGIQVHILTGEHIEHQAP